MYLDWMIRRSRAPWSPPLTTGLSLLHAAERSENGNHAHSCHGQFKFWKYLLNIQTRISLGRSLDLISRVVMTTLSITDHGPTESVTKTFYKIPNKNIHTCSCCDDATGIFSLKSQNLWPCTPKEDDGCSQIQQMIFRENYNYFTQ